MKASFGSQGSFRPDPVNHKWGILAEVLGVEEQTDQWVLGPDISKLAAVHVPGRLREGEGDDLLTGDRSHRAAGTHDLFFDILTGDKTQLAVG
ncbi:unnamed protein product [marine sediment metagenome]|uniref:Uncharacterized protein n=1 Tax=marine sediment metagenome TaxID=412755 RepID=X0V7Z5_9ZZZZ